MLTECLVKNGKGKGMLGVIRNKARSRGRSSPDSLAF